MNRTASRTGLLFSLVLGLAACQGAPDVGTAAEEMTGADDSPLDLGLSTSALTSMDAPDPTAAAGAMLGAHDADGCKTRVKDASLPNVVHVYLDNCTGRFGRHTVSGEIVITFSPNADGTLHAEHQSVGLTIDGHDATRTASVDITFEGQMRHVVWHGEKSTTREGGEEMTRVADHVVDVDRSTGCSVLNGTATMTRGDRVVDAVLTDLTSCDAPGGGRYCPTGLIEATAEGRPMTMTKTFDGTETVTIERSGPKGDMTREVLLDCVPQE